MVTPLRDPNQAATIQSIVKRLTEVGIPAVVRNKNYAEFDCGVFIKEKDSEVPIAYFDVRANPLQIARIILTLDMVGLWAVSDTTIFIDQTSKGTKPLTMAEAYKKYGSEFAVLSLGDKGKGDSHEYH